MLKLKYLLFAVLVLLSGYLVSGIVYASDAPLTNGDFEGGGLSPWNTFATVQGTLGDGYPKIGLFDIDGDGVASNTLQFSVGRLFNDGKTYEGGGVYQPLHLAAGDYNISAEIASVYVDSTEKTFGTSNGGLFELLFDNVVLDSHNFGRMGNPDTKYTLLASLRLVSDGDHEIRIRVTRPEVSLKYVTQMVDNVVVAPVTPPVEPAIAPEPVSPLDGKKYHGTGVVKSLSADELVLTNYLGFMLTPDTKIVGKPEPGVTVKVKAAWSPSDDCYVATRVQVTKS